MPSPPAASRTDAEFFALRWSCTEADLTQLLERLYGGRTDIPALMARGRALLARKWAVRPRDLRAPDFARDIVPD